jgi:putative ABC transport system substrate-binding protein
MIVRRAASAAALAFAIVAAPSVAYTQPPPKIPRIGYLGPASPAEGAFLLQSFRQGLRELGYVEGQNIFVDYRWTDGRPDRGTALAAELVQLKVDLIVTYHNQTVGALQRATRTIPIVVAGMSDPVQNGFVASLARPGGNITGFSSLAEDLNRKRMELLTEAVPKTSRIAVLAVSQTPSHHRFWLEMQGAAGALKLTLQRQEVAGPNDIEPAFARLVEDRAQGLIVLPSALTNDRRTQIVSLAAKTGFRGCTLIASM